MKICLRNILMAQKLIPDDILGRDLIKAGRQYRSGLALLDRFSATQRYVLMRFIIFIFLDLKGLDFFTSRA